jgi:transcriptional regulator with XRE-family HTH domain
VLYLEYIRRARGYGQVELSQRSGIQQRLISGFEIGRVIPRPHELRALANALDVAHPEALMRPMPSPESLMTEPAVAP